MARKPAKIDVVDLPQADYLRLKLVKLEAFLESPDALRNGASYVAGTRLAATLRGELEALRNPAALAASDPTAGMTDAEVIAAMGEALRALPLPVLDEVLDNIGAERAPRASPNLRVVDGGP